MKTQAIMIAVLVGAVVALGSVLILTNLPSTTAQAEGGGGGGAGSVVALTTEYAPGQNLLYVIDSQAQTILVYGFYSKSTGQSVGMIARLTTFDLVAGRSYKYDAELASKAGAFGETNTSIKNIREKLAELGR